MLPRWEESPSERLGEVHPLEAETLVPEELETEGLQKQKEEEEELGILQYLDQLEQVTARFLTRSVSCYQNYIYNMYEVLSVPFIFSNILLVTTVP
jgi:hypothetical protein